MDSIYLLALVVLVAVAVGTVGALGGGGEQPKPLSNLSATPADVTGQCDLSMRVDPTALDDGRDRIVVETGPYSGSSFRIPTGVAVMAEKGSNVTVYAADVEGGDMGPPARTKVLASKWVNADCQLIERGEPA